jgi:anaerobic selenocysteine-containing dehydrogenase
VRAALLEVPVADYVARAGGFSEIEIDNDRSDRILGVFVDSANPAIISADTQAYHAAFLKLNLLVGVDLAFTETARLAHYVLPAASQFEKSEMIFINMEFPTRVMQLSKPPFSPRPGTVPEREIYRRLFTALGELPEGGFPVLPALARIDRRFKKMRLFPPALATLLRLRPAPRAYMAFAFCDTLGRAGIRGCLGALVGSRSDVCWKARRTCATNRFAG